MPAMKIRRRSRLTRRQRLYREAYHFTVDEQAAIENKGEALKAENLPTHIGEQSNHLRF